MGNEESVTLLNERDPLGCDRTYSTKREDKRDLHRTINGYTDHIHFLFGLNADMSFAKALQLIKGESAYWVNKQSITKNKFEWADEYYASSVSESDLATVRKYIRNQEEHHTGRTYQQEVDTFMEEHQLKHHG